MGPRRSLTQKNTFTIMDNEDTDLDSMTTTFNTAVIETAREMLGKHRQKKKKLAYCRKF